MYVCKYIFFFALLFISDSFSFCYRLFCLSRFSRVLLQKHSNVMAMVNGEPFRTVMAIGDSVSGAKSRFYYPLSLPCVPFSRSLYYLILLAVRPSVRSFAHSFFVIDFNVNVALVLLFLHYYQWLLWVIIKKSRYIYLYICVSCFCCLSNYCYCVLLFVQTHTHKSIFHFTFILLYMCVWRVSTSFGL